MVVEGYRIADNPAWRGASTVPGGTGEGEERLRKKSSRLGDQAMVWT